MPVKPNFGVYNLPYHCPKCDEYEGFTSIQMLREHLEMEHSPSSSHKLMKGSEFPSSALHHSMPISTEMGYYTSEAAKLEKQLATLKDAENKHRTQWQKVKYTLNQYPIPVLKPTTVYNEFNNQDRKPTDEVISNTSNISNENIHSFPMAAKLSSPTNFVVNQNHDKISDDNKGIGRNFVSSFGQVPSGRTNGSKSVDNNNLWTHTNKEVTDLRHSVARLKEQLEFKDTQLKKATEELQSLTSDRIDLQRQVLNLSKGKEDSGIRLSHLEGQLEEKDKHILHKQDEITLMSKFLHELSLKETIARQRLEDYVNLLLERTEKAESRLRKEENERSLHHRYGYPTDFSGLDAIDLRRKWNNVSGELHSENQGLQYGNFHPHIATLNTETPVHQPTQRYNEQQQLRLNLNNTFPQSSQKLSGVLDTSTPVLTTAGHGQNEEGTKQRAHHLIPQKMAPMTYAASPSGFSNYSIGEILERTNPHTLNLSPATVKHTSNIDTKLVNPVRENTNTPSTVYGDSAVGTLDSEDQNNRGSHHKNSYSNQALSFPPQPQAAQQKRSTQPSNKPSQSRHSTMQEQTIQPETLGTLETQRQWLQYQLQNVEKELRHHSGVSCSTPRTTKLEKNSTSLAYSQPPPPFEQYVDSVTERRTSLNESDTESYNSDKDSDYSDDERYLSDASESSLEHGMRNLTKRKLDINHRRRDALYCIFMYLDTKTLSQISVVCKEWRDVSRDPSLWRNVELKTSRISSKFLYTIATWCTELQILHLTELKPKAMKREKREDYEKSIRGSLEHGLEELLKQASKTLISLKIVDCGELITDRCLWLASCYNPSLQRVAYVSDTDPAGPEVIYSLGAGCRNITTLLLHPQYPNNKPHKFNNKAVQRIAQSWPDMRVLCIGGVDVNVKGLAYIGKYCKKLEVLEFDHMNDIIELTAAAVCIDKGLQYLHTLEFTFTPVTPKALVYFMASCPRLQKINVLIGMSDYFEDTTNALHVEQYEEIVYQLKSLKKRPEFKGVLFIRSDYG